LAILALFTGCDKYYVSVRQIHVDDQYLASTHVGTPDPRRNPPPSGQKLVIDWQIPPEVLGQNPKIVLHLLFKNHVEMREIYPIKNKCDTKVYSLLNDEYFVTGGLLTYRAEIVLEDGEIYRDWKHQLWVNLITLD
jgi:hypothetical protein